MSSILTNVSAMTALRSLQNTNNQMEITQNRISTGMRVAEASDNAAYWSIATTMRSDNKALSTVQDALGLGASKIDVAYTGMNSAIEVVDEIKTKLVAAREPGVDRSKIQSEISQLQEQLTGIASAAGIDGSNWLSVDSTAATYDANQTIVSSFNRAADGSVSISTISIDISSVSLFDANGDALLDTDFTTSAALDGGSAITTTVATLDISGATVTDVDIEDMISEVDSALQSMTTAAADLGAAGKRIDIQTEFVTNLMDAVDRSVGQLVDADMSAESTKLQALQTQQQLGIQALSIANGNAQSILALFR
ncbi:MULTISPECIES: flagellin [unclassified Roseitalea]|uniref:flagellin N-terminal helical domain-containing protein n=1 Tax=unclassified Roseitalea TaxID=2639107 RepID=UPI00273F0B4B|nr:MULTISPECIES: flagellin [unclassified Roseitalea]